MKHFSVFINGTNFLINKNDKLQKLGFYVTVYVDAITPEEAEDKAIAFLRKDQKLLKLVKNERSDPPVMYANEINELEYSKRPSPSRTGFVFYPEKSEEKKQKMK